MEKNFTLDADIATGWKPKMSIIGPMPLNFDNLALDKLIKPLIYSDTSPHEVVYLGKNGEIQGSDQETHLKCMLFWPRIIDTNSDIFWVPITHI